MKQELDVGLEQMKLKAVDVQKELLVLRMAFGKLKAAASTAFAPVAAPFLEGLQKAVFWATRLVKNIGIVLSALTGLRVGQDQYTKAVTKTVKAVKRELAGFDELNRLGTPKGGQVTAQVAVAPESFQVPENLQGIIQGILRVLEPLRNIEFTSLRWHLLRLRDSFLVLWDSIKTGTMWVWEQVLTPFAGWIVEELAPRVLFALQEALEFLTVALQPLAQGFARVYEAMRPVFSFMGDCLTTAVDQLRRLFVNLSDVFTEKGAVLTQTFANLQATVEHIWQVLGPKLDTLRMEFALAFGEIRKAVSQAVASFMDAFAGLSEFLLGVFTGDWDKAWKGLKKLLKNAVNGILALVNGMLKGLVAGVNGLVRLLNKLKFSLPDWIPVFGGKSFSLNLKEVTVPQIPYLAKGAVLPANKPFLAMVGDQKHGTNIEAPLATIQEAVATVMGDMVPAMVAGFEALLGENIALRRTVEGISLGDDVLANAVNRYNRKMEIVRGV